MPFTHRSQSAAIFFMLSATLGAAPAAAALTAQAYASNVLSGQTSGGMGTDPIADSISASADAGSGWTANAFAAADLRAGTLRASSRAYGFTNANSYAYFADTLNFTIPGADANTLTPVRFVVALDGNVGADGAFFPVGGMVAQMQYRFGVAQEQGGFQILGADIAFSRAASPGGDLTSFNNWTKTNVAVNGNSFTGTFTLNLRGAAPIVRLTNGLDTNSAWNGNADYAGTGTLRLRLPTGVTYTSASGEFLSAVGGVPEPASWAMLITGFGLVGVALRRRPALAQR